MDLANFVVVIFPMGRLGGNLQLAAAVALHVSQILCFCGTMSVLVPPSCCKQMKLDSPVDGT